MIWFLPRSDPGTATEYLRPNGCGVSTETGALLPYGRLPRLLMLWMYAECERTGQGKLDLVYALSDYLLALEVAETPELVEQAERLFDCGLHVVERAIPVVQTSTTQLVGEDDLFREVAPLRATRVELSEALCEEMRLSQAPVCLHTVRAVQDSPFELDVYLWERGYCDRDLLGAPPAHSRLARYHALAERPLHRPSPRPRSARSRASSTRPARGLYSSEWKWSPQRNSTTTFRSN